MTDQTPAWLAPLVGMRAPITGRCLCGSVSYVCSAAPFWSTNCHCRACQKLSGAPFVSAFSVPAETFAISGETIAFHRVSESGHAVATVHCKACGARICAQSAGNPALMNVFATTLDEVATFTAISNVYLCEAAGWIEPPRAPLNFQKMPERRGS